MLKEWRNLKDKLFAQIDERKRARLVYDAADLDKYRRKKIVDLWNDRRNADEGEKLPQPLLGDVFAFAPIAALLDQDIAVEDLDVDAIEKACVELEEAVPAWRERVKVDLAKLAGAKADDDTSKLDLACFTCARTTCEAYLTWPSLLDHQCARVKWSDDGTILANIRHNSRPAIYTAQPFAVDKFKYDSPRTDFAQALIEHFGEHPTLVDIIPTHATLNGLGKSFRRTVPVLELPWFHMHAGRIDPLVNWSSLVRMLATLSAEHS